MPRRFLTAEDVRSAPGSEIVVDESTVVTPQALEVAQAAGVRIRSAGGAEYAEPAPDRGPDAPRSAHQLPFLPEPTDTDTESGVVVTAVGRNRPGVLAEITHTIAESGCDVLDISQKEVQGYFHLILTVRMTEGTGTFHDLKRCLECLGGADDYVVRVMHERVFRFMHRV